MGKLLPEQDKDTGTGLYIPTGHDYSAPFIWAASQVLGAFWRPGEQTWQSPFVEWARTARYRVALTPQLGEQETPELKHGMSQVITLEGQ